MTVNSTLASNIDGLAHEAAPARTQATEKFNALLHQGLDAVQGASQKLRAQATHVNEVTVDYIRKEPIKSVLIAAATGAVIVALVSIATRSRSRH